MQLAAVRANAPPLPVIHQLLSLGRTTVLSRSPQVGFHSMARIAGVRGRLGEARSATLARFARPDGAAPILHRLMPTPRGLQNAHRHVEPVLDQLLRQRGPTVESVRRLGPLGFTRAHRDATAVESEASGPTASVAVTRIARSASEQVEIVPTRTQLHKSRTRCCRRTTCA